MPDNINRRDVWLIGAGQMASDYAKVLKNLNCDFTVIGRSEQKAQDFEQKTGLAVIPGGVEKAMLHAQHPPQFAIVAVDVEQLAPASTVLLDNGVKHILVEKPAGLNYQQVIALSEKAADRNAQVYVAYNRHFYASVMRAKEIIAADGGVVSFHFEFTEWSHVIEKLPKSASVFENWFFANSTHVVDLAFYLGGYPTEMCNYIAGSTPWYKRASVFSGAGVTEAGALFSYQANWKGPGRWSVEFITSKHRLIFRPVEQLQVQNIGSVATELVELDDELDKEFKPGLFIQTRDFLAYQMDDRFVSIQNHCANIENYKKIENFKG